jgi:hypothetical protein
VLLSFVIFACDSVRTCGLVHRNLVGWVAVSSIILRFWGNGNRFRGFSC